MFDGFMPHGMCFQWHLDVLAFHVVADALVAAAYFSIPAFLVALVRRRPDLPFGPVFWMFSLFIVSCGMTHVLAIIVIWYPVYWIEGIVKAITALASVATAIACVPLLPRAFALRSPAELDRLNSALQRTLSEREELLRQYEREHHVARTLQSAALGTPPQSLGGFTLDAVYRPGSGDLEIGGDWYDAFELPDGRVVVSVGDVDGKGLAASLVMAKMRQAVRVAAQMQVEPAEVLGAADRALRAEEPDRVVTAFVAMLDRVENTLIYASAGHPGPLIRQRDGTVTQLPVGDLPLGLWTREHRPESHAVPLSPDSLLVFYTDGLVESTHDYAEGEARLFAAVQSDRVGAAEHPALAIYNAVLNGDVRDDVALLAIRVPGPDRQAFARSWQFAVADGGTARTALAEIEFELERAGIDREYAFGVEIVYSELIANVVRYAPGDVVVKLDLTPTRAILHVLDEGPGFLFLPRLPNDLLAESGRGLFLVAALTDDFHITRRPGGGSHARAVLVVNSRRGTGGYAAALTRDV